MPVRATHGFARRTRTRKHQPPTPTSTRHNFTITTAMDKALAAIEALGPGESFTYADIARRYGVQRSTLSRRHRGVEGTSEAQAINQQKLNPQQEYKLVLYINKLNERGLPPTRDIIRNFASEVAKERCSDS